MKSPAARASCRDWCVVGLALSLETAVVLSTWISLVARDARNSGNGNILRGRATAHPSNTEACYSFRFCESHSHLPPLKLNEIQMSDSNFTLILSWNFI